MLSQTNIQAYIQTKQYEWAATTQKSEYSRLVNIAQLVDVSSPVKTYEAILANGYSTYAIQTIWVRLLDFLRSQHPAQYEAFRAFRKSQRQKFKFAYQPKTLGITYAEAKARILTIADGSCRDMALMLLSTGMRLHEAYKVNSATGQVHGKGNKLRVVFMPSQPVVTVSQSKLRRALASVGLTPHDLRKLFATQLVAKGAKEADLLQIMGWSSILTAKSYLQPKQQQELAALVERAIAV